MIRKLTAASVLVVIASLLVSGCININTPSGSTESSSPTATTSHQSTPTPKPVTDYSSKMNEAWTRGFFVIERPFIKSTNYRGDDIYTGVIRRTDRSEGQGVTCVVEFTKSKDEAKRLFDDTVAKKQSQGFVYRSDWIAQYHSAVGTKARAEEWAGSTGSQGVYTYYLYDSEFGSWTVVTQTS